MKIINQYGKDLESIRKLYQKCKNDPPVPRNLPPVSGKIAWARQLYRRIEAPMRVFKKKPELLKVLQISFNSVVDLIKYGIKFVLAIDFVIFNLNF